MSISRKDFFRKSLLSLGEAFCTVGDALKGPATTPLEEPDMTDYIAAPRENEVAVAHNDTCLARSSGCFSCVERCEHEAVNLIQGVGIRIDPQLCTGCRTCEYICPVTPKAIRIEARTAVSTTSANQADLPRKGESPC